MSECEITEDPDELYLRRAPVAPVAPVVRVAPVARIAPVHATRPAAAIIESLRADLAHAGLHDHLTGLPNRARLLDEIRVAIEAGQRVAVLFCDVDRFKLINDSRSHSVGDTVLMTLASRLQHALRVGDTLGRFGGDELVVVRPLEPDETDASAAEFAATVREVAARPMAVPGGPVIVSLSIGIAWGSPGSAADDVLRDADAAMYRAKESGRARVTCFDDTIRSEMAERVTLESRLRHALLAEAITVAYQPIVDLDRGSVVGFEALARWHDPVLGPVSPDRFVPVAEDTRLVHLLGASVLKQACAATSRLADACSTPLSITINLSRIEVTDPGLPSLVASTAAAAQVHPCQLTFEVTESGLVDDLDAAVANLERLRALGCRVSLDDFGTGYSSLSQIKQLPLDVVKIDRAFIPGLTAATLDGTVDAIIVESVVRVAGALGHEVVAEGIEEPGQLRVLRDLGVTHGQGYLVAAPLVLDDAVAFVRGWDPRSLG